MNAIFLDMFDYDAMNLDRLNRLVEELPEEKRLGLRRTDLLLVRPSRDIGQLAGGVEPKRVVLTGKVAGRDVHPVGLVHHEDLAEGDLGRDLDAADDLAHGLDADLAELRAAGPTVACKQRRVSS